MTHHLIALAALLLAPLAALQAADPAPPAVAPPLPADAASMGKLLCGQIDLSRPGLEEVRKLAAAEQYAAALAAWRDWKVVALRQADLGPFLWHGDQLSVRRLAVAESLTGHPAPQAPANPPPTTPWFEDRFGLTGPVDRPLHTDWLAKDGAGHYSADYMNFFFAIPLAVRYWQSGEPGYLKKWFQITADFACNQKRAVELLDAKSRREVPCNWTLQAQAALSQGDRVISMIRSLGVFCKSLPEGGKPAKWDAVYQPVTAPLSKSSLEWIPPLELAQLAWSLVRDHPGVLLQRYQKAGAVPNQRRNGLTAVLLTATAFPEFAASRDLLANGCEGLNDYLEGAFHADGGMLEQSFNYNLGDADSLGEMASWLQPVAPSLASQMQARRKAFYRLAASLATPLGRLPAMSSHCPLNPPPVWTDAKARAKWLADSVRAMPGTGDPLGDSIAAQFTDSATQAAPPFTSVAFPYSGYYAQRLNWRWDSPYLFMQGCRRGRGHSTMGHNAIQVIAYGRPLLVSAGPPVYAPEQLPESMRPDFQAINELLGEHSSWKANTVLVDGHSQNRDAPMPQTAPPGPIAMRWHASPRLDFMEGYYDQGYPKPGVSHRRQVIFVRNPGFWIVTDIMVNTDQMEHQFTQVWNFPGNQQQTRTLAYGFKNEQVVLDAARHAVHTEDPAGPNLWMSHCGGGALDYVKHYGEKNPYLGWFSPGFGNLMPAPQVLVNWHSAASSVLVTVIWPTPGPQAPGFKLRDLSPAGDPAQAALALELPDGTTVNYQASAEARPLQAAGIAMTAQALLAVTTPDRTVRGLVVGRRDGAVADSEFRWDGQAARDLLPIQRPAGFSWHATATGIQPAYAQPD